MNEMNVMIFAVFLADTILAYALGYMYVDTLMYIITGKTVFKK